MQEVIFLSVMHKMHIWLVHRVAISKDCKFMKQNQSHCIEVAQGGVSNRAIHNNTQLIVNLALFEGGFLCFRGQDFFF